MTSIFEGQPPQNKAFSNQNRGHLGSRYILFLAFSLLVVVSICDVPVLDVSLVTLSSVG